MAEDQVQILAAAKKLPFAERVAHKSWFVRSAAFEDIATQCQQALEPDDKVFEEVGPLFVKGVCDTNANALDKCFDALLLFLANTTEAQAARIAAPTCANIASKDLKQRPATVKKAADVVLAFIEQEQVESVMEPLFKAFGDKVPKAVVAALDIVTQAFSSFGPKVVKPQLISKALPALFEAKQEPVRDGVKKLAVELSAWLGADYVQGSLCGKMPDAMRKDVEKLMEDAPPQRKQPERFTRKEQAAREAARAAAGPDADSAAASGTPAGADAATEEVGGELDSYEFAEPADILGSLGKEFWEGLGAKKWTERRDALAKLKCLASQPRLAPGDYGDVLRELRKIIQKDSMVVIVGEAILCVGAMAKSLRSNFTSSAKSFFSVILEKFKDPKTSVTMAVNEALTNIHKYCVPLPDLAEDLIAGINHKNPKVKVDTAKLLMAFVDSLDKKEASKVHSTLLPVVAKSANDPAPDVREANMAVLVSFALKTGNMQALLDKFGGNFDEARKKRLDELAQQRTGATPAANGAAGSSAASPVRKTSSIPPRSPARPAASQASRPAAPKAANGRAPAKAPSKKGTTAAAPSTPADDDDASLAGGTLSDSEAKEKMLELLGSEIVEGLQHAGWKERLASMESLLASVKGMEDISPATASMLVQGVACLPGWSEKNFQVLGKAFEVITFLSNTSTLSKKDAFMAIGGLVDKMSDIKLKGPAGETLTAFSEALGPQFVFTQLHKKAGAHKNPKVMSESLLWMAKAIDEFTLQPLQVQTLIDWAKGDLASTNAAIRNAAINLMATCHKQLGTGLAAMIRNDVKPALMTALEDAFKNNPQQQVAATRKVRNAKPKAAGGRKAGPSDTGSAQEEEAPAFDPDELLPRTDISGQITSKLIASLGSSNWKERNATMDEVEDILKSAGGRIQPALGDLIPTLKGRLTDTNKNLVAKALTLFGKLAKAVGPAWERSGRPVLQQATTFLADNKKQVRDAAVGCLDAWVGVVPADKVLPVVVDFLTSPKASNEGKVTGLRWVASVVQAKKAVKCVDIALRAAATASTDKGVEVREAGTSLATTIAQEHSTDTIAAGLSSLPGSLKRTTSDLMQKVAVDVSKGSPPLPRSVAASPRTSPPEPSSNRGDEPAGPRTSRPSPVRISQTRLPGSRESSVPNTPSGDGPCLQFSNKKEERMRRARFKSSKFEVPRDYEAAELEEELGPLASDALRKLLFSKDFKRHMEAADMLVSQLDSMQSQVISCLDLLLRWIVLRICDANTSCLLKVFELSKGLIAMMFSQDLQLSDSEAHTFLPCLIEKSGLNQERLRAQSHEVIRQARAVVPVSRMVEYLVQGLSSKNNRSRVECVELLAEMLEEEGLHACERGNARPFAAVAQLVTERDQNLRAAVLKVVEQLCAQLGEARVWDHLGRLDDKQQSLIRERLKFAGKQAAKLATETGRRQEAVGRSADHQEVPIAPPSKMPRLGMENGSRSRRPSNVGALQTMPVLSNDLHLDEQMVSGGRQVQYPPTPAARSAFPPNGAAIPTPMPARTPGPVGPSPLNPSLAATLEVQDDEEIHNLFTEALLMLEDDNSEQSVEGAKRICYVLQAAREGRATEEFMTFLAQSSLELVKSLTSKIDWVVDLMLEEAAVSGQPPNPRAPKYVINALLLVFDMEEMAVVIPMQELKDLIFLLLARMLDSREYHSLGDEPQLMKALNVLMYKILAMNWGNAAFEALIQLLLIHPQMLEERGLAELDFNELITKCLIKLTRLLPERIDDLDVHALLLVIHQYFMKLGVDEIRRRGAQDEKSLRMVKTLLHELCKLLGEDIREHMWDIPRSSEPIPIIHVYVDLHLETLHGAGLISAAPASAPAPQLPEPREAHLRSHSLLTLHSRSSSAQTILAPTASATVTSSARSPKPELKHTSSFSDANQLNLKEVLPPILSRIGDSKTSDRGLEELYTLKKENPGVDLAPILGRLSTTFHSFVEKGLQRLERRDAGSLMRSSRESSVTSSDSAPLSDTYVQSLGARIGALRVSSPSAQDAAPQVSGVEQLLERRRMLRSQHGI